MRLLRSARLVFAALLLSVIPASSFAGVFISVNFGPPVLPVYEQPLCPRAGTDVDAARGTGALRAGTLTTGFPGAWVSPPYYGALWTPGYWGWANRVSILA